jgi:hypothetical protein
MTKRQPKTTPLQDIQERQRKLMDTRLKAHSSGASGAVLQQIERMMAENEIELYTESELERHRNKKDDEDGEQWIV